MNYISISSILNYIPAAIKREEDKSTLLSYALDAYRDLGVRRSSISDIKVVPIVNHTVALPSGTKLINFVYYTAVLDADDKLELCTCAVCPTDTTCTNCATQISCGTPGIYFTDDQNAYCSSCFGCLTESLDDPSSTINICRHTLNYQLALNTTYLREKAMPMKFVGNANSSLINKNMSKINMAYTNTWSVNPLTNQILTSIKDGYLVIDRQQELIDAAGNYLIIDLPIVKKALAAYAKAMHWEGRDDAKEQGAGNHFERALIKAELLLQRARGSIMLRGVDDNLIREIDGPDNYNQRLMRSPFDIINKI